MGPRGAKLMAGESSTRHVALSLLERIRRTEAYANLVFAGATELGGLEARDRAFVTRLVYGTLQMEGSLDAALAHVADKGRIQAPPAVRDALRLGAYQLLFTKVPPHAAISETLDAIHVKPAEQWRGLANALLRSLAKEREGFPWIDRADQPVLWLALKHGHPAWLVERLLARYGEVETERILAADNEPAPTHLRVNTLATIREHLIAKLEKRGYDVASGSLAAEAVIVGGPAGVWTEPEAGREFVVQDMGSLLAPHMLAAESGQRVLDMAAGRGGKATHLAALMGNIGRVVALDVYESKTRQCREMARALGATIVDCLTADARTFDPGPEGPFDAVLLDAPCTGTGTLRRRAELRWRLRSADLERLLTVQRELLDAAARLTRPGGRLVYATCSLLAQENDAQVEWFLAAGAGAAFKLVEKRQLLTPDDGTDGHFAALLVREPEDS